MNDDGIVGFGASVRPMDYGHEDEIMNQKHLDSWSDLWCQWLDLLIWGHSSAKYWCLPLLKRTAGPQDHFRLTV